MAAIYRQRHPESTVLYRVLATHFDSFLTRYETLFQRRYGYLRPVVREVVERYLDCANPMCGSARIRCPECASEQLPTLLRYTDDADLNKKLAEWEQFCNFDRPHGAFNGKTPYEALRSMPR
jgi:transposase InsO family protein